MRRYRALKNRKRLSDAREARGALDAREKQDYAAVNARAGGRCEVVLGRARCSRPKMFGLHHVTKRSQGGKRCGEDGLLAVCFIHHRLADDTHPSQRTLVDGQWVRGRLMISALGGGRFRFWMETAAKRPERSESS